MLSVVNGDYDREYGAHVLKSRSTTDRSGIKYGDWS
jgi:hypothetical protein